ncbi:MFS transporter [Microbacterium sp. RURRCA19A]|uniref:MFS transporter n=1 Tax=Microbacterium sp. RURRCA19A TaxID=1907391 RepID=UPI000954D34F|nr:MFS transporter [Microbacterium sp. RURRCA19A]SIS09071.1 Major Facilitator Superfamily protein [Microbacterium sp. RURRCA19A]
MSDLRANDGPALPEPLLAPTHVTPAAAATHPGGPAYKSPWRVGAAVLIGGPLWLGPFVAGMTVFIPAQLEQIAPDQKVGLVALISTIGAVVAFVSNIFFGALSDRTRSRFGRRAPWMIFGSIVAGLLMVSMSFVTTLTALIVVWTAFTFFLNAIVATMVTLIPDRVSPARRGTYSALYGTGVLIGGGGGGIIAASFVQNVSTGYIILGIAVLLSGPVVTLISPDRSNKDQPRETLSAKNILSTFSFPRQGARDFYLALIGKLAIVIAVYMITGYQLYVATDYFGLDLAGAGALLATMGLLQLGLSLVFGLIAGPISDKLGRRKLFVIASALIAGGAALIPFFWADPIAMLIYASVGLGFGFGIFNSVDQALNYDVLPNENAAAKDLGILNMANGGGQIIGPILMASIVGITGGYGMGFVGSAVLCVVGAVILSRIKRAR